LEGKGSLKGKAPFFWGGKKGGGGKSDAHMEKVGVAREKGNSSFLSIGGKGKKMQR